MANKKNLQGNRPQETAGKKKTAKQAVFSSTHLLCLLACLAITLVCYVPSLDNKWTNWDDEGYVLDNDLTKNLNGNTVVEFFTTPQIMGNYHPFAMVSLAVDYSLFGDSAGGFHAHSVLLHLINVLLVFLFVWLLTKKLWAASLTALFFGIHPAHIESVSWIAERKDLLYVLYYMAALIAYVKFLQTNQKPLYFVLALVFFLFSLLSKGQAVTLSVVLVLIDYYLRRPFNMELVLEKVPFFVLSLAFGILAVVAQKNAEAINDIPYYEPWQRPFFAASSFTTYFYKAIAPLKLSAFYPYPLIEDGQIGSTIYITAFASLVIIGVVIVSMKYTRTVAFGFAFFLVNIILLLQLLPVGGAMMADRYTYLSYIGLFFIMGMALQLAIDNYNEIYQKLKIPIVAVAVACTVFFGYKSYARNDIWKDSESLYLDMLNNYSYIPVANNNLGNYYNKQGKTELAFKHFSEAIRLQPDYKEALINRSDIYRQQGKIDSAIWDCEHVMRFDPDYSGAYMNRGIALSIAGRFDSAMHDFNKVISMDSTNARAYGNRGNLLDMRKEYDSAIADYERAIRFDPEYLDVYGNLGRTYMNKGMLDNALKNLNIAVQVQPENPINFALRSDANNAKGNYQQALNDALIAQRMGKPINPAYIDMLKGKVSAK